MKGHQVVELPSLDQIVSLNPESGMARSILAWIAFCLSERAIQEGLGMRIDLIKVQYISEYPALGIFYFSDKVEEIIDQEEWVVQESEKLLSSFSLNLFSKFLKENRQSYISKIDFEWG